MKKIFVIHDNGEIITTRDTMDNAIAACINRIAICGYICEGFSYGKVMSIIAYRDIEEQITSTMTIEEVDYKEGV